MARSLLGEDGAACALSCVPFEVNAEETAAILCPSSLVVHGRSGTGKTTVIIHRALLLHRLFCHSTIPIPSSSTLQQLSLWGDFVGEKEDECSRGVVVDPGRKKREQGGGQRRSEVRSCCESIAAPGSSSVSSKSVLRAPVRVLPQYQLVRNYRTHNGILKLASSVVQLLRSFFPSSIDRLNEELSAVEGVLPVMAAVSPAWKRQLAQGMPLSATQVSMYILPVIVLVLAAVPLHVAVSVNGAIIVRSADQKKALSALFPVKPVEPALHLHARQRSGRWGALEWHCSLCTDLKQLYLAITRAKQRLWVLDETGEGSGPYEEGARARNHSCPMMDLCAAMGLVVVKRGEETVAESVKPASEDKDWRSLAFTVSAGSAGSAGIVISASNAASASNARGDYEVAEASYECTGDTLNARFSRAMLLYEAGMGRAPPPSAAASSSALQSACPSALPSVHPDLSLLSASDLLLAAARLFEGIGRGAEAGRAYSKARSFEDAVRLYLSICHPPDHLKAARCYEKLGRLSEAADCYSAGGDMHSALSVCLRARSFSKGLSLLDSWQAAEATSASGAVPDQESLHLKGWYVTQCALKHEEERDYKEMVFIRLHPSLQAKREFLEKGQHLRQLAEVESEEGDSTRVPLLLQRAGMLLEAALCLAWLARPLPCMLCAPPTVAGEHGGARGMDGGGEE
ncbi:unnamed protein product [Closterium sp. Naga37s-1]|nr:unnamed protein product [Closterium sp. Naga37s-1]